MPAAVPGIMTGAILAMSRAIGEAAPILIIAGIVYINRAPQHLMDDFTVMPMQIYNWTGRPQDGFHGIAAAAIIVLLLILLSFNAVAVLIRQKLQKPLSWMIMPNPTVTMQEKTMTPAPVPRSAEAAPCANSRGAPRFASPT